MDSKHVASLFSFKFLWNATILSKWQQTFDPYDEGTKARRVGTAHMSLEAAGSTMLGSGFWWLTHLKS